jgi:hypothetical protein
MVMRRACTTSRVMRPVCRTRVSGSGRRDGGAGRPVGGRAGRGRPRPGPVSGGRARSCWSARWPGAWPRSG